VVLDGLPGLYGFKYDSATACGLPLYLYSYKLVDSATRTCIAIMQISSIFASSSIFYAYLRWYASSIYFLNTTKENVDFLSQTTTLAILGLSILTSEFSNT